MAATARAHSQRKPAGTLAGSPFTTLPFINRSANRRRHWSPPPAATYEQACAIGAQCGADLVAWLRANPDSSGQALLIWTVSDMLATKPSPIEAGYRAGFLSMLARVIASAHAQEVSHA